MHSNYQKTEKDLERQDTHRKQTTEIRSVTKRKETKPESEGNETINKTKFGVQINSKKQSEIWSANKL